MARGYPIAMADVANAQLHEITAAQLTVNAEVEQRKFSGTHLHLEPDPNRPDVFDLQRRSTVPCCTQQPLGAARTTLQPKVRLILAARPRRRHITPMQNFCTALAPFRGTASISA